MKHDKRVMIGGTDLKEAVDRARRSFMLRAGAGVGALAAAELLSLNVMGVAKATPTPGLGSAARPNLGTLGAGQFPAQAKRVIYLHMLGAYSCVDTFDYKPTLIKMNGQPMPASVLGAQKLSAMSAGQSEFLVAGPVAPFHQHGQSRVWVSDLFPHTAGIVDDLCFIKTMSNDQLNHDPGAHLLHTGFQLAGRPSAGAWISYALGSDNANLPNFVTLAAGPAEGVPLDADLWSAAFLPSDNQGVEFRSGPDPVLYLNDVGGATKVDRRSLLDGVAQLARTDEQAAGDSDIFAHIRQYEMAYRMQQSVPLITDFSDESKSVLEMYGPDVLEPGTFAHNCLIARRLSERGVKFITLYGLGWDHHSFIAAGMSRQAKMVDQASAALVKDLKQRGMLEDTLVLFGGEFGRTSFAQGSLLDPSWGRDHHGDNFTWWLAGGGTKAGYTHGETDDFNYSTIKDKVTAHDLNATILRLLGIDNERLTYRYAGRDYMLTDTPGTGNVIKELIA